jgi:putative ABC transport system permease protein
MEAAGLPEWLHTIRLRLTTLGRRRALHRDLKDEIAFHIAMREEKYRAAGISERQARVATRKRFGNPRSAVEACHELWTLGLVETVALDVRCGIRMLLKKPGLTAAALVTLALGLGVNTAIFGMVDSFLLRPLPVTAPQQLTVLAYRQKSGPLQAQFSIPEYLDIKQESSAVFSSLLCYELGLDGLTVDGKTEPTAIHYVSGDFFATLGIQPYLGRFIYPTEGDAAGADPVAVLGYSYWASRFASDAGVVGKQVAINGRAITIIGVAPKEFRGVDSMLDVHCYLPIGMLMLESWVPPDFMANRDLRNLILMGRLRGGVSIDQARAELELVASNISRQHPLSDDGLALSLFPERLARPQPDASNTVVKIAALFLLLSGLVLILAAANVANLLLVRATRRQREMAVRAALGGCRRRLIRQMVTESAVLVLLGGLGGVFLGSWAGSVLSHIRLQSGVPLPIDFQFDWRLFAFALVLLLGTGTIISIAPAMRASRSDVNWLLRQGGRTLTGGGQRMRSLLVAIQVAGSVMLLIVGGLLARSLQNAEQSDLGFDPVHILNLTMDPHGIGYSEAQGRKFYNDLLERVRALPGVASASLANVVPMGYTWNLDTLRIPGYDLPPGQPLPIIFDNFVSPGYFRTMGIGTVAGRDFDDADVEGAPRVTIVNQAMAARFWPGQDPIGREFTFGDGPQRTARIVGIVRDSRFHGMAGPIEPYFYAPWPQVYSSVETLQVRGSAPPATLAHEIIAAIHDMSSAMPVFDVQPMTEALNSVHGLLIYRAGATLAAALGVLGLVLALVGVYGVVSYSAGQQTQEVGIRMALGARWPDILRVILGQGVAIIGIGLGAGLVSGACAARLMTGVLVGVSSIDPVTYVAVSATLGLTALAACYLPARRAMRIELTAALRYE